ncbi:MAG: DNA repair protein [Nitrospira sp.]|nr:MAG: DNA repair protein [Nitrospira sp.]
MSQPASHTIWTIGHSTRPIDEFIAILCAHDIGRMIDVRTIPRSRNNPQFNTDTLSKSLKKVGLTYFHMPQLGGLRKAKKDSINLGWRNASFRGYADYMQTNEFQRAIEELMAYGTKQTTAVMCAEAVPWRCHRSLIADALIMRGWEVRHIMSATDAKPHQLTSFARIADNLLRYPKPDDPSSTPRLF